MRPSAAAAGGCRLRVSSSSGAVLLQCATDAPLGLAAARAQIELAEGIPAAEQLLLLGDVPLISDEALQGHVAAPEAEGEVAPSGCGREAFVDVRLRRVSADWPELLLDLSLCRISFEQVRARLWEQSNAAQFSTQTSLQRLASLVEDMRVIMEDALSRVNESGSALLAAAGDLQRNRDTVFEVVPRSSKGCRQAAEELAVCRSSVLAAVEANGEVLRGMQSLLAPTNRAIGVVMRDAASALAASSEAWRREGELLHFARAQGWLFSDAAQELEGSYATSLRLISQDTEQLQAISDAIEACRQAYRRAVVVNRNAIRQAEASLQRDQEVIFGWAVDHVSELRKCDRNFIMAVVEANGEALERAPEELRHDRELVLVAVTQSDGWALQFAAEELRRDREVVLAAVRHNGFALEHAAEELRCDRDIVLTAVRASGEALEFAGERLRNDREVVLMAVRRSGGWALQAASAQMKADREVAAEALRQNGLVLELLSEALRADRDLVLEAVQGNGLALEHASAELREDVAVVEAATRSNPQALRFAGAKARANREVVRSAIAKDGYVLEHASEELRADRALVLEAALDAGTGVLEYASKELRCDPSILKVAVNASARRATLESNTYGSVCEMQRASTWALSKEGPECVQL